jgi:hypothetical protein
MNTDKSEVRHALTTYTVAMRQNLAAGNPIFTGIRKLEEEIENCAAAAVAATATATTAAADTETTAPLPHDDEELMTPCAPRSRRARRVPAMSENDPNYKIERDNAALAEILAKELAFLNRTIQMISLIAARYQEEQDDLLWGRGVGGDGGDLESGCDGAEYSGDDADANEEEYYEDDSVPTPGLPSLLQRSCSSSYRGTAPSSSTNQLSATFLIASGRLRERFNCSGKVRKRYASVNDKTFDLMKDRHVRGVRRLFAKHTTRHHCIDRWWPILHHANLYRRCMSAQDNASVYI